jgi:predicted ATP-dependent endonuclease of OLD family
MKIASIHLKKFKRFEDLKIADLPPARLVVLTGPNGCGKSTVFDGLLHYRLQSGQLKGFNLNDPYYARQLTAPAEEAIIEWHGSGPKLPDQIRKAIDVRSAYRHEPGFNLQNLNRVGRAIDEIRFSQIIHQDQAVSKNYQRLASLIMQRNVDKASRSMSIAELQDELFGPIESSLSNLFPNQLAFESMGDPLADGTFYFKKGVIPKFPYMNLSSGEKAAFDLVLDLGLKRAEFNDTVFCVDEPEAHMSTRLQGTLLTELVRLLPDNSQLWIATHSIGMMRRAREMYEASPGDVVFLDFSEVNGDIPAEIRPIEPTRTFWRNVLSIALDDLSELVVPGKVVVCEGNPKSAMAGKNQEHDARC